MNIHEAKTHFSKLVDAAIRGEDVIIAKSGRPVVKIIAITPPTARTFGLMKGKIKISPEFDAPLSEAVLKDFEGK